MPDHDPAYDFLALFGGPNADGCCFAAFGPLEAGSHTYSIEVTDHDGVNSIAEGFFDVIA